MKLYHIYVTAIVAVLSAASLFQSSAHAQSSLATPLQPLVDRQELAGAVMLVADKDGVLAHESIGFADIEAKKPMQKDSYFWIASQSKPITAAALMMLVDEGKVDVNDPVEKYLPEFRGQMVIAEQDENHVLLKKPVHPITIKNVLSHTSGLPFSTAIEVPSLDRFPLADRVRSYAMVPLRFEPDSKYQYSNAGINTAGRIIEVVTKKKYEDFLQERLFGPLGMTDTTFWPNEEQLTRLAKSYKPKANGVGLEETVLNQLQYKTLTDHTYRYPMPAGGLFSTATDLSKFYRMLLNGGELDGHRYLSKEAVKMMTSQQTPTWEYGFGFSTGGGRIGHGGAYSTNSYIDTKQGLILIWLVQHDGFPGQGNTCQDVFRGVVLEKFGKK